MTAGNSSPNRPVMTAGNNSPTARSLLHHPHINKQVHDCGEYLTISPVMTINLIIVSYNIYQYTCIIIYFYWYQCASGPDECPSGGKSYSIHLHTITITHNIHYSHHIMQDHVWCNAYEEILNNDNANEIKNNNSLNQYILKYFNSWNAWYFHDYAHIYIYIYILLITDEWY